MLTRWKVAIAGILLGMGVLGALTFGSPEASAAQQCPPGTVPVLQWSRSQGRFIIVCRAAGSTPAPVRTAPPALTTTPAAPKPTAFPTMRVEPSVGPVRPTAVVTATATPYPWPTPQPGTPPPARPTWVPPGWQWLGCTATTVCPINQGESCWGLPNGTPQFCSSACDCRFGPAPTSTPSVTTPPAHGGSLPDPLPPGFDGFFKQVQAQVGTPIAKYQPFPSGLVNTDTSFWVDATTPLFAPSASGAVLTIGAWTNPTGDPHVTWRNYHLSLRWRLQTDAPFVWDFADGSPKAVGGFGKDRAVHHVYQRSSYGQPLNGPHDPNTAETYPNATPAFPVTVTTFWTAEWHIEYDEDRVVDDSHCVAPSDPSATDHSPTCPGDGPNHHSGTRHVVSHVGPTSWQQIDLRQLGSPTSDDVQTTTLPTSIVQLQSILVH